MKFGHFDDVNKEYVITTPKTPLPWINYLGNTDFFSLISNTSGGYSFYKDAKLLRVTRYRYNGLPGTEGGHYFYIKDGDKLWNPGWMPTKTETDKYECRQGLGYSVFTSEFDGLKAEQLTFVPMGDTCEVTKLTLSNNSDKEKDFKVYSYVEFCLWNAMDDMTNFQRNLNTGEVEVIGSTIYHKTEFRERRNHYAVFSVNEPIDHFDTDRESFLGQYCGFEAPTSIMENGDLSDSIANGWFPIGSHQINISLKPGESKSLVFVLGYCECPEDEKFEAPNVINKKPANELLAKYNTPQQVDDAFDVLKNYWNNLLSKYTVDSKNDKVNRMVNIWNQYQCMVTFNMSRSASYYESGIGRGMGFRDSCQDLLGFVHLIPDRARERIIDIASTQFQDGSAYHQYQPLTKKGNADIGSGFNDDPLWLIACVSAYIKETGDYSILDETVPYDNDMSVATSLFEHLTRSLDYIINHKGPHNLPLIGRADWNDCLNLNCFSKEPGESFQTFGPSEGPVAESVFIAGMFVKYGREYADLCDHLDKADEAARARAEVDKMIEAIEKDGWDGEWFIRAYDAYGEKIGSKECEEGQIYIEPQGFCVLADVGIENGIAKKALDSVKEKLDTKYGIVILQPPYTNYHLNLGEISSYPPGYKENAGIFCHNNPWVSAAETRLGRGNRAFEIYQKTCPAYLEEISEIHMTEPYVYAQMIAGKDAKRFGQAKNSWLTGTAAWTFVNISQYILGIQPTLDGLSVDPCIPSDFGGYTISRQYRDVTYNISVENTTKVEKGVSELIVDGKSLGKTTVIPYSDDKKVVDVKVIMG